MSPPTTTRWCPTAEQVMILEEMYRGGMRTPNAALIQKITAHLSDYGRVEGKNVFYWFQNHKARDRQRFRRKQLHDHHHLLQYLGSMQPPLTSSPIRAMQYLPFLPQPRGYNYAQAMSNNYTCDKQREDPDDNDQTEMRRYRQEHADMAMMMIVEMPYATARPTKTLQLFPLTATNVKEI